MKIYKKFSTGALGATAALRPLPRKVVLSGS